MPRLFFAVNLSEEAREVATRVQAELRRILGDGAARWSAPAQFHFTLKFLGETPEERLHACAEAASKVVAQFQPFRIGLSEVGAFPNPQRPKILWIGASGDVPVLVRLAESLEGALADRGFPREENPFRPHLTLARVKSPNGQQAAFHALEKIQKIAEESARKVDAFAVESFVLLRSELHPAGSVYTALKTYGLGGKS